LILLKNISFRHRSAFVIKIAFLFSILFSSTCLALQFKNLKVNSTQGETLDAAIELNLDKNEDPTKITFSIAPKDIYQKNGIEKMIVLDTIKFNLTQNDQGAYILHLKNDQSIEESFITALIQIEVAGNRLIKEANFFIGPNKTPPKKEMKEISETFISQKSLSPIELVSKENKGLSISPDKKIVEIKDKTLPTYHIQNQIKVFEKNLESVRKKISEANTNLSLNPTHHEALESLPQLNPQEEQVSDTGTTYKKFLSYLTKKNQKYIFILGSLMFLLIVINRVIKKMQQNADIKRTYQGKKTVYGHFPKKLSDYESKNDIKKNSGPKPSDWRFF